MQSMQLSKSRNEISFTSYYCTINETKVGKAIYNIEKFEIHVNINLESIFTELKPISEKQTKELDFEIQHYHAFHCAKFCKGHFTPNLI